MPSTVSTPSDPEGRHAGAVTEIPVTGWKAILIRTAKAFSSKALSLVAGGVAFFLFLAIFPALASFVALYGLVFDVSAVERQVEALSGVLPEPAVELVSAELERLASTSGGGLGAAFLAGVLVALWSANAGVKGLMAALNVVYDEEEGRGFVRLSLVSLAFTVGGIGLAAILMAAVAAGPSALGAIGLQSAAATAVGVLRWPLLLLVLLAAIGLVFRYGPSRSPPRWRWIVWGVLATALLWIALSALFSFYLSNFANYSATYGALGAVIGVMMWLYLSAAILLAGAALNAEIERQVATDTTTGPAEPLGRRGAVVADTLP